MALLNTAITLAAVSFFSLTAHAVLPTYSSPELMARAHYRSTFSLPPLSYLNNTSPVINNFGEVAFKVMAVNGTTDQALWLKTQKDQSGKVVYVAPNDRYVTDPNLNDLGQMTYSPFNDGMSDGLFVYDSTTGVTERRISGEEAKISYFGFAQTKNDGTSVFRGMNSDGDRGFYDLKTSLQNFALEGATNFGIPAAYLFSPAMNEVGQWAFKVRVGAHGEFGNESPDKILLLTRLPQGDQVEVIAEDTKANQQSSFTGFGNSLGLANNGLVVFVGHDNQGRKSIVVRTPQGLKTFAKEGEQKISEIELFRPKINSNGIVVFRAKNEKGLRGIYLATETELMRVIGEGDHIPSDLGDAAIYVNDGFPGFAGEIDMNESGEIVFACVIADGANKVILGDAIYKLSPKNQ